MTDAEHLEWDELGQFTFDERVRAVYREGAAACRASTQPHASCVRYPDHKGACEAMGFDEWGPKYVSWRRKGAEPGLPLPPNRRLS
jgi:hypothetical protein